MKPPAFRYQAPETLDNALALLDEHIDVAKILAGGQSLVPALNFRLTYPELLIDINRIPALQDIVFHEDGSFDAGALVRHRVFETDPRIKAVWPLLSHATSHIAHVQVRNRGTIGGSLSHADPSAEWPALCLVCDTTMVLVSSKGERRVKAQDFFLGLFETATRPNEILTRIDFPRPPRNLAWGFEEIARRTGDFAIVGVVCALEMRDGEFCESARIVVFGASDRPELLTSAANVIAQKSPGANDIRQAAKIARDSIKCRADQQASADYRRALIEALTTRVLAAALKIEIGDTDE